MKLINRVLSPFRSKKLRESIWKFMTLQALLIVVVVSVLSYFSANSAMQDQVVSFSSEILDMKARDVDNYILEMEQQSKYVLKQLAIYEVLNKVQNIDKVNPYFDRIAEGLLAGEAKDELDRMLEAMVTRNEIQSIAILDNKGTIWAYDNHGSKSVEIQIILDKEIAADIMNLSDSAEGDMQSYLITKTNSENILLFSRCIYSPEDYSKVGYLVLIANSDDLTEVLASGIDDKGFGINLYTGDGLPVYAGDNDSLDESIEEFINRNIVWQVNNKENVLFVRALTGYNGWSLVSTQRLDVLFSDIIRYRKLIIGISIVIILILTYASWRFASSIVKPITAVTEAMQKVRAGATDVDVAIDRQDEIGYMSQTFNTMVEENRRLVNDIYREQITKQKAELQALQSQINPHFLFNTLETISWKARLSNVEDISEMVEDLSDIMRVSIGKNKSMTELSEEIKYIQKYLDIMKKRFEDRLTVKIDIDKELDDYMVPRLLIQPIIENAIYHGIDGTRKGGMIFIGAKVKDGNTVINVCNTGKGMPDNVIDKINKDLMRKSDEYFYSLQENQEHNVGLENVNRRTKLSYGEEYGIQVEGKYGFYLNVIMTLPKKSCD